MANASGFLAALDDYVNMRDHAIATARRDLGVSELEVEALRRIAAEPGIRPSNLRAHLGVTAAGVTTLVDRLIGRGLLRRELDDVDRRVNHIYLEIDLDAEPWVALRRFPREVADAVDAESAEVAEAAADLLRRVTGRVRSRI